MFHHISCLLPVYFRCNRTGILNPQLSLAQTFYKGLHPPRVMEGLWMAWPHPYYISHCSHTSSLGPVSYDHLWPGATPINYKWPISLVLLKWRCHIMAYILIPSPLRYSWKFLRLWTLLHQAVGHFAYMEQSTNTGSCVLAIGLVCAWVEVPRPF